ncbi:hypothetical protein L3X38_043685 [Prunus dulcis]|uniref:Reverse transcriptase Ty1/copia-type domain-containing protein n=1 Tax=Prunus dulcis TaxID=3755 RepID=A0AAD4UYK9_PRUDU|nr:hypothetical protein L3X38_043685 [Prunus dulcis]
MKGYGEDLTKGRIVQKLLISLTKEFDPVYYVIEQTRDIETIEVQEVIAALRGFAQRLDRHAESTTELDTIRTLIALVALKGWKPWQLDVKSAFLNGVLEEEVYVDQPDGFVVKGDEDKVYRLRKALYGLK